MGLSVHDTLSKPTDSIKLGFYITPHFFGVYIPHRRPSQLICYSHTQNISLENCRWLEANAMDDDSRVCVIALLLFFVCVWVSFYYNILIGLMIAACNPKGLARSFSSIFTSISSIRFVSFVTFLCVCVCCWFSVYFVPIHVRRIYFQIFIIFFCLLSISRLYHT